MTEIEHIRKCSQYLSILLRNNPDFEEFLVSGGNLKRKYPLTGLYSALGSEAQSPVLQRLAPDISAFQAASFSKDRRKRSLPVCGPFRDDRTIERPCVRGPPDRIGRPLDPSRLVGLECELDSWRRLREKIPLIVLGLGKLGGHELNYVSDVDLIFLRSDGDGMIAARISSCRSTAWFTGCRGFCPTSLREIVSFTWISGCGPGAKKAFWRHR